MILLKIFAIAAVCIVGVSTQTFTAIAGQNANVGPIQKTTLCSTTSNMLTLDCTKAVFGLLGGLTAMGTNPVTPTAVMENGTPYIVSSIIHGQACTDHPNNKSCRMDITQNVQNLCDADVNTGPGTFAALCTININTMTGVTDTCFAGDKVVTVFWACAANPCLDAELPTFVINPCTIAPIGTAICTVQNGVQFTCLSP